MKNRILKILLSLVMVSLATSNSPEYDGLSTKKMIIQDDIVSFDEIEDINRDIDIAIEKMNQRMIEIDSIESQKEWFIAYKNIIKQYSDILDPPETIYDYYTIEELDMLFRVVQAEVGDEYSFAQKVNVISVIFNRIDHEDFGNEMLQILTKDQFQPISDGTYLKVEISEETILACEYCFIFGDTTNGCLFFDSNGKLNYEFVYSDGAHNFYR